MRRGNHEDNSDIVSENITRHGWHVWTIVDDGCVAYSFSVGMHQTLGTPEICLFGLRNPEARIGIINHIGSLMRDGLALRDGDRSDEVLDGYPCIFRAVPETLIDEHFGSLRQHYGDQNVSLLQCIWPDRNLRYPGDDGYGGDYQPVMATWLGWPFAEPRNLAVITTVGVLERGLPVRVVSHDADDGGWQFLCGTTTDPDDGRVVALSTIYRLDPSLRMVADLPIDWRAEREAPGDAWERASK